MPKPLYKKDEKTGLMYRPGTKDERVLVEVIEQKAYRNSRVPFDVQPGETWLDLGGHIGTFGYYAMQRGAKAVHSIEPHRSNYCTLQVNTKLFKRWTCEQAIVSHREVQEVVLHTPTVRREGAIPNTKYSMISMPSYRTIGPIKNVCFDQDLTVDYDGIKMDIEGAEHAILNNIYRTLDPRVTKLVLEYHFGKDRCMKHFHTRMKKLRKVFKTVYFLKSLQRMEEDPKVTEYPGFFDRLIYCVGRK